MEECCASCKFWNGSNGYCLRYAPSPRVVLRMDETEGVTEFVMWPVTDQSDWCGDYQAGASYDQRKDRVVESTALPNGTSLECLAGSALGKRVIERAKQYGITQIEQFAQMSNEQVKDIFKRRGCAGGFGLIVRKIKELNIEWNCRFPTPKANDQ